MENNEKLDIILSEIRGIKTHIENVTDKNIETIAEGHLDLSRKLDNALKVENEKELLIIRVRMLEDEIRQIKDNYVSVRCFPYEVLTVICFCAKRSTRCLTVIINIFISEFIRYT